ncbi:MAG: GAF domain-containing protein, partial [Candidatus Kryptonium sp.]
MSGKAFASLITFFIILITGVLIYLNEHFIIRNFESRESGKIDVLFSNLKHAVKSHLLNGEGEKFFEFIQGYKDFPGIKLVAVFDSLGNIVFDIGDRDEIPSRLSLFQADVLRYIPERRIYEAFSRVWNENGKSVGVMLKVDAMPYRESIARTNLLIFTLIALIVILGFIAVIATFSHRVIKPISKVSGLMQDIARGVYNVQLEVSPSSDIYEFAENFNQMVKLLDEKEGRLERQKSQFKVISEISRLGLDIKSVEEFFKNVVVLIRNEFNFLNVIYFTVDSSKKLRLSAISGYLENYIDENYVVEVGYGIAGSSVLIGDVIVINDVSRSPQFIPLYDAPIQSELAIPIKKKGKIVGVLDISSEKMNAFTSEDVKVFKTIAETISVILEKFDSTVENVKLLFKLESVYKLTRDLVLIRDIDRIFENAVKIIHSVLGKKELVVEIYERVENLLVMKSIYGSLKEPLPYEYIQLVSEGIIGKAV